VAVRSTGDWLDAALDLKKVSRDGAYLGAEYTTTGPLFTAAGGHPTQMLQYFPPNMKDFATAQFVRLPKSADEGRAMVRDLKKRGVDGIKVVFDEGSVGMSMKRFDVAIAKAVAEEARAQKLPVAVHTHSVRDIEDAIAIGATSIEHGSMDEPIPDALFAAMVKNNVYYDPTLAVADGYRQWIDGKTDLLELPMVRQTQDKKLLEQTRRVMVSPLGIGMRSGMANYRMSVAAGGENLKRAIAAGVKVVTGTDAGNPLTFHGPGVHRELQLWVRAGITPKAALMGATSVAAELIGLGQRIGQIKPGYEASLFVVDGNPLADITSTERIWQVWFKGERIIRPELFDQE
ncbi:MAG: amidohydrolase family protein, partial [Bryobacteraceae bacterium]|nr:amidohydrolase family protein [Bryobacteraceae bacterium]